MKSFTLAETVALTIFCACPALAQVDCKLYRHTDRTSLIQCTFQADGNPQILMITSTFDGGSSGSWAEITGGFVELSLLGSDGDQSQTPDAPCMGPLGSKPSQSRQETAVLTCNANFTGQDGSTYRVDIAHTWQKMNYVSTTMEVK
jgi:hypothetical protein